ncbi:MAG TPA: urease accessory UreF family protein [Stellaceae bacterium]|nr:urease accessory UreF family protein [Stellaceae bacterium]
MTTTTSAGLYRLFAWLSPAFPIGAFSYSHGLEAEVEAGRVHDRATLERWITTMLRHGGGRLDADLLRDAYRGEGSRERGLAYRATAELVLESSAQGDAFTATVRAAWTAGPHPPIPGAAALATLSRNAGEGKSIGPRASRPHVLARIAGEGGERGETGEGAERSEANAGTCHAVAVGEAAADVEAALEDTLTLYLQSFASSLMSAGLRLGVIGQTDGQRILAALEPVIAEAVAACIVRDLEDFGAASFAGDIASMAHETQYTRLFRS